MQCFAVKRCTIFHYQSEREKSAKDMAVTDNAASSESSSPGNQTPTGSKRKSTGSNKVFDLKIYD